MNKKVDLNSDLGESFGAYKIGNDENVIPLITSANVACGWHAGDSVVMQKTVSLCKGAGIAVGAHPGYPDLMGFGRRALSVTPAEMKSYIMYQVGALQAFLRAEGMTLQHVKPHGAMYNAAAKDIKLSRADLRGDCRVRAGGDTPLPVGKRNVQSRRGMRYFVCKRSVR